MRKSMKKLIALTLACLMLATLFVGCGKKDDGGSSGGDTIKLGWMGSLTGDQAAYGTCESQTLKMMVEDLNANGGLLGKQVELICYIISAALLVVFWVVAFVGGRKKETVQSKKI